MKAPENFTRGDIPDELFYEAFDAALEKKSRISIAQILKHGGINQSIIENHADEFIKRAKRLRVRARLPHIIIAWCIVALGVFMFGYMLLLDRISGIALGVMLGGVLMLAYLRD